MDAKALQAKVQKLLGFRIVERENDAVAEFFYEGSDRIRAVHPATSSEVVMYLKLIGLVAHLDEVVNALKAAEEAHARTLTQLAEAQGFAEDDEKTKAALRAENDGLQTRIQDLESAFPNGVG